MKHPERTARWQLQGTVPQLGHIILLLMMLCAPCRAEVSTAADVFDIAKDAGFSGYQQVVRHYIGKRQIQKNTQVCVLGKTATDSSRLAWVIWMDGQEIILYEQGETDLKQSRRKLNLKKDVVENDAALQGSTYLVTREWVAQLRQQCQQYGTTLLRFPNLRRAN